jgi:hypothetical protein
MQCSSCGGAFEWAGNGRYARCLALFSNQNGQLTPIQVQAPGGGTPPAFNAMFAQNLGFGPPPQQQQHNLAAGTFDMGGGQQLKLKINGESPEGFLVGRVVRARSSARVSGSLRRPARRRQTCRSSLECTGDLRCRDYGPNAIGTCGAPGVSDEASCGGSLDALATYTRRTRDRAISTSVTRVQGALHTA